MNSLNKIIVMFAVAVLAFANTACNEEGLKGINGSLAADNGASNGSNGDVANPAPVDDGEVDMSKLNAELDVIEEEMQNVTNQLAAYNIGGSNSGAQAGLDKAFREVFEKLLGGIAKAKEKVNELKAKIQERVDQLDPNNPLHLLAIQKLQEAMLYLDQVGERVDEQILRLVDVIDNGVARIDERIAELDNIAAQIAAMFLWEPVKLVIFEYRDRLIDATAG